MNALHVHIFKADGSVSLESSTNGFLVIDDADEFKGSQIKIMVDPRHCPALERAIAAFNSAWMEFQTKEAAE